MPVHTTDDERRGSRDGGRGVVVRPVVQFALVGLTAVAIVALATAAASRRVGEREAITNARTTTLIKAQGVVEPVITDGVARGEPAALAALDRAVEEQVLDESLVRVKIWTADGTIAYSDKHELQGSTYDLGEEEQDALSSGLIEAEVSDLAKPENRFERQFGKLLEVYLPVRTPSGERLLFEAYYRFDAVAEAGRDIWRSFAPIAIGALLALELIQIPLAWSLAMRLRQRQREREELLERAIDASDVERRRIATDLHDGVVQDLVGVSYELAGASRDAELTPNAAALLDKASAAIRANISALRSTLVEIYPPDLHEVGLVAALHDVAGAASSAAVQVVVDADPVALPDATARVLYRVVREAVTNAVRHAGAKAVTIRAGAAAGNAWVSVTDDGSGFDPQLIEERARDGHLGLRGLRGMVTAHGGTMQVDSSIGKGTVVNVEVPVR